MKRLIVFSGAGISSDSGIPTFQEIPNIREKLTRDYAISNPKGYTLVIEEMRGYIAKAYPNDAHLAIADYDIPVITMNIDGLHQLAGSKEVIALHGDIDTIVLYGDMAPKYHEAINLVASLAKDDTLLVVGASYATQIAYQLRVIAQSRGVNIVEIQESASIEVPRFLNNYFKT